MPVSRALIRHLAAWTLILVAAAGLLYLRYDWDVEGGRFAERGFALSAYLLAITLPTCFYLTRKVLHDTVAAAAVTAVVFVAFTLPYELLGLTAYYDTRPQAFVLDVIETEPSLEFFPGGTLRAFPYDYLFMPMLFALGSAGIWTVWWFRQRAGLVSGRHLAVLLTLAFAAICVQAYLHSSMRAPYTYLSYFQLPESKEHWYHIYNFADASGASQADHFVFAPLEDYFQGNPRDGNNMLVRRPFSFFVASQGSYFINTFYVWLGLNCLFWLVAVLATGRLVERLTGSPRAGRIAAALTVFGPGFVAFAATPAMYMQNFTAVAVALCAFEDLVVRRRGRALGDVVLFGAIMALCALVYDLTPLFAVLAVYGLVRKVAWLPLLVSLGAAFLVARGFVFTVTDVLGIAIDDANSAQLTNAVEAVKDLVLRPTLPSWYDAVTLTVPNYVRMLLQVFFVIPAVVALWGLPKLKDTALRVWVGGILLGGYATVAALQIADELLGEAARLVYPTFPAIYLLAALALDMDRRLTPAARASAGRWARGVDDLRAWAPWIVVAIMAVLVNVDIFGYPTLYVEFFVGKPPKFLP